MKSVRSAMVAALIPGCVASPDAGYVTYERVAGDMNVGIPCYNNRCGIACRHGRALTRRRARP